MSTTVQYLADRVQKMSIDDLDACYALLLEEANRRIIAGNMSAQAAEAEKLRQLEAEIAKKHQALKSLASAQYAQMGGAQS